MSITCWRSVASLSIKGPKGFFLQGLLHAAKSTHLKVHRLYNTLVSSASELNDNSHPALVAMILLVHVCFSECDRHSLFLVCIYLIRIILFLFCTINRQPLQHACPRQSGVLKSWCRRIEGSPGFDASNQERKDQNSEKGS